MKSLSFISLLGLVVGCASHSFMRGTVAMKIDEKTAHVCLGEGDVKKGDKVIFYKNQCSSIGGELASDIECDLKILGEGKVARVLNSHYSEIKMNSSFEFEEGTLVQKKKK